ncbi:MAG: hypothetical protein IPM48_11085 [Saprospiraceae bacterium]|nr:hypothetical protein [Saprospiraceae bacterium]
MKRISSASTLIWALFIPVSWFVLFFSFGLGITLTDGDEFSFMDANLFRGIYWILFLFFGTLIYFSFFRLRRVELDADFVYVTNYFKTIRIPRDQIKSLLSKKLPFRLLIKMSLYHRSYFGQHIYFICDNDHYLYLRRELGMDSAELES